MANINEIKTRMKSIKETRQITQAMKLISAAKLKKARRLLDQTLPYYDKVKLTIVDILTHSDSIKSTFFEERHSKEDSKKGLIVLSGDKGLSGGYNHNIIKLTEEKLKDSPKATLFVAGYIGRYYFTKKSYNVDPSFDYPVQDPTLYRARDIAETFIDKFKNGELDEIYLVYTLMHSTVRLQPVFTKLLPINLKELRKELNMPQEGTCKIEDKIIYEPSPEAVLDVLISKYVKGIIYGAFVEAFTSEQSSRMTAMDNATANADEMLHTLALQYNRARQAAITREISEIIGGTEALNG
ncbi:MAG: ATP synthase F1 subunit gamma [Acetivibrionales bacterium]|jgi:F-type H+-transporting ATPase subunit gamma